MTSLAAFPQELEPQVSLAHQGREDLLQIEKALSREWLQTDGLGGYASNTVLDCPTRRYHGLLAAAIGERGERFLFLSRFEESVHGGEKSFHLSMCRYRGLWFPHGYQVVERFDLAPWPRTCYRIGRTWVFREVLRLERRQTVLVRYEIRTRREDLELRLRPLTPFREAGSLTFENLDLDPRVRREGKGFSIRPYEPLPALYFTWSLPAARFEADPVWYRGIEYADDLERGYDGHEDQFSPGRFLVPISEGESFVLAATLGAPVEDPAALFEEEAEKRLRALPEGPLDLRSKLEIAARDFLYETPEGRPGIVAGWPWFGEWGRDTFISLPGLTLSRGDLRTCRRVLEGVLPFLRRGLLPNVFGKEVEDSQYGSADASLWFARAVRLFELESPEEEGFETVVEIFLPALEEIARCYRDGTELGIRCDDQGMLLVGDEATNATWMDARVDGAPVTPRPGSPVEVVALWYHLLTYLERIHEKRGDRRKASGWKALRRKLRRSFLERFWIEESRYLGDCYEDGVLDRRVRPNMVIAAALEFSPLSRGKRTDILGRCEVELLTPFGLRTLSPQDPDYKGRYEGTIRERDRAYHQGTVWPWLLGFWVEGALRANGPKRRLLAKIRRILNGFEECLGTQGLNQISEVHDGDPPHRPGGTIAQAWSVAELLRSWRMLEDASR